MIVALAGVVFLAGCRGPKFAYKAPPAVVNYAGPTILVMPLCDGRTNRAADGILRKRYMADVQKAIGSELQSMNLFSLVVVTTNRENFPAADYQLNPTLQRLDWEVPHKGWLKAENIAANLVDNITGVPTEFLMLFKTPVYGNSSLDVSLRRNADQKILLEAGYCDTVTNRVHKSDYNRPQTKATVMVCAFQKTMADLKTDVRKQLALNSTNAVPKFTDGQ